jgi:hypothetical protein
MLLSNPVTASGSLEKTVNLSLSDRYLALLFPSLLLALQFANHDESLDHDWLEYSGMEVTKEAVTDSKKRDIGDLVDQLIELAADFAGN